MSEQFQPEIEPTFFDPSAGLEDLLGDLIDQSGQDAGQLIAQHGEVANTDIVGHLRAAGNVANDLVDQGGSAVCGNKDAPMVAGQSSDKIGHCKPSGVCDDVADYTGFHKNVNPLITLSPSHKLAIDLVAATGFPVLPLGEDGVEGDLNTLNGLNLVEATTDPEQIKNWPLCAGVLLIGDFACLSCYSGTGNGFPETLSIEYPRDTVYLYSSG